MGCGGRGGEVTHQKKLIKEIIESLVDTKHKMSNKIAATLLTDEYRTEVCQEASIHTRGYVIPKSALYEEDYMFLKNELTVQPETPHSFAIGGSSSDVVSFPVYRENETNIYIPRFYGIERYGLPKKYDLPPGDTVDIPFTKPLRDYQNDIIDIYIRHVGGGNGHGGGAILEVPCGQGKTVMALKIGSVLSKKMLILVHKEFLMNQWIERIAEFLPTARVGKIQGTKFEIKDKDIVIGMIQTMYNRDFPQTAFHSFGLTIIDEVHRIGSEEFSKTLLKTVTPYMLGISATVERKDGLTKILYMFIGEKIYSGTRKDQDPVCVRGIEYVTTDDEFNTTEVDWKGNTKFSTMITKICNYGPRSDFIVKILQDIFRMSEEEEEEEEEGGGGDKIQVMVLAHNRSLLTYLHDAIAHRGFASAGYYVGGMKESELKKTEEKQIVLATYAMAAEALDIKTLCILVMATPKTDIEQSVGRILREKHANPMVVDIIDKHDTFQNQWRKRKTFYRKNNYKILQVNSNQYRGIKQSHWIDVNQKKQKEKQGSGSNGTGCIQDDSDSIKGCMLKWY